MAQEKANYAVTMMARVLEVSRSGFYAWSKRRGTLGMRRVRQHDLDEQVRWFHDRSRGTYGAPRITADLHAAGVDVDRKTVARSMKRQGLEGLSTRSFRTPGRKTQAQCRHEDLCERTWDHGRLNAAWVTDSLLEMSCRKRLVWKMVKQRLSRLIGVMTLFQLNAPMGETHRSH